MRYFRSLGVDLVDKRLWPVAVLLLAALVAIPLFLAKPDPGEEVAQTAPTGAAAPLPGVPGQPIADVSASQPGGVVEGAAKDPFEQQHLPRPALSDLVSQGVGSGSQTGSTTGSGGAGSSASSASSGSSGNTGIGGQTTTTAATTVRALIRFGQSAGVRPRRSVEELSALPSAANPLIVYIGQSRTGIAEFLVSSDAKPTGDGRCVPNRTICSSVFLEPGDTEYFDVTTAAGSRLQYQLDYLRSLRP